MIKFLINKALGKKSEKEEKSEKIASKIKNNVKNFSGFLSNRRFNVIFLKCRPFLSAYTFLDLLDGSISSPETNRTL